MAPEPKAKTPRGKVKSVSKISTPKATPTSKGKATPKAKAKTPSPPTPEPAPKSVPKSAAKSTAKAPKSAAKAPKSAAKASAAADSAAAAASAVKRSVVKRRDADVEDDDNDASAAKDYSAANPMGVYDGDSSSSSSSSSGSGSPEKTGKKGSSSSSLSKGKSLCGSLFLIVPLLLVLAEVALRSAFDLPLSKVRYVLNRPVWLHSVALGACPFALLSKYITTTSARPGAGCRFTPHYSDLLLLPLQPSSLYCPAILVGLRRRGAISSCRPSRRPWWASTPPAAPRSWQRR